MNNENWEKYVNCFRSHFENCNFKDELIEVCGGYEDIACVVFFHTQDNAISWMNRKIPALDNKIPSQEIKCGNIMFLKKVIMRIPC